jgi:hypothetical protein
VPATLQPQHHSLALSSTNPVAFYRFVFDGFGADGYSLLRTAGLKLLPDGLLLTDLRLAPEGCDNHRAAEDPCDDYLDHLVDRSAQVVEVIEPHGKDVQKKAECWVFVQQPL